MKSKVLWWAAGAAAALALAAGIHTLAQDWTPKHFSGVINDYTPVSATSTTAWELRGPWSLTLNTETGTADFSAALTMEFSINGQNPVNVQALNPHTHHVKMTGATITYDPTDCPLPASVTPIPRIEVSGMATITANGGPFPPGSFTPVPSHLQVCIDGGTTFGTVVTYSNITLAFQAPASGHFGSQPIHGVIRKADWRDD